MMLWHDLAGFGAKPQTAETPVPCIPTRETKPHVKPKFYPGELQQESCGRESRADGDWQGKDENKKAPSLRQGPGGRKKM